jgi:chromosome segregation protein
LGAETGLKALSDELNACYIKQSEIRFALENADNIILSAEGQAAEADRQSLEITAEIETLKKEAVELVAAKEGITEKQGELENRSAGLQKLFAAKQAKADEAAAGAESLRLSLQETEQRIKLLSDLEKNMEGFAHSVKEILKMGHNNAIRGVCGTVGGLISVEKDYALAIETALGAAVQNVIVENEETAKRCINHLKETRGGRATFLPLTSIKGKKLSEHLDNEEGFCGIASELTNFDSRYTAVFENLLGRTAVFEDIDSATEAAKKFRYSFKIVTLDGQVINAGGSFTGGSSAKQGGILSRKNEIERLTDRRESIIIEYETAKARKTQLFEEANKLHFDIEGVKDALRTLETDLIRFEAEEKRIAAVSEKLSAQLTVLSKTA